MAVFFLQKAGQSRGGALHSKPGSQHTRSLRFPSQVTGELLELASSPGNPELQHRGSASVAESQKYLQVTA